MSGAGGLMQMGAQKTQAKVSEATGRYNAALEINEADQAFADAQEQIRRSREMGRRFQGQQRAAMSTSGVVMGTGSPLDVEGQTAGLLELDIQEQARAAELKRRAGYSRAAMSLWAGENQATGYKLASYGTLLGGAANAWNTYQQTRA